MWSYVSKSICSEGCVLPDGSAHSVVRGNIHSGCSTFVYSEFVYFCVLGSYHNFMNYDMCVCFLLCFTVVDSLSSCIILNMQYIILWLCGCQACTLCPRPLPRPAHRAGYLGVSSPESRGHCSCLQHVHSQCIRKKTVGTGHKEHGLVDYWSLNLM